MSLPDPPVDPDTLPPLVEEPWQPIDPRYKTVLRGNLLLYALMIVAAPWVLSIMEQHWLPVWMRWHLGLTALVVGFLIVVWVPRRVRHTRFLLRELDMHLQVGCWWRKTLSVAINRIQHIEVTQGPLERLMGLSKLVLYTAGGHRSDLKVPGLPTGLAHRLKARLSHQVAEEDVLHDGDA